MRGTGPSQDTLLARVKAAKASLSAIPAEDVDALVLLGGRKAQIVTLQGGDTSYRLLVEAMSEGAAILSSDGAVLYCNRRFADLLGRAPAKIIGGTLQSLVDKSNRDRIPAFLKFAQKGGAKGEFTLQSNTGVQTPVHLSVNPLRGYQGRALGVVVTDLTEQRRRQER